MANSEKFNEPRDRLTLILNDAAMFVREHDLYMQGDRGMFCMVGDASEIDSQERGGIVMFGYSDEREGIIDAFVHLKGLTEAYDIPMAILPVNRG